jgi:shikimate dehydrogenase
MKSAHKKIYGLIGYPVKHSLSPLMHNAAFEALKINAEYRLFEVGPENLEDFLSKLDEFNISGINVTVPHKEKVLSFIELDQESSYLRQIKAVNTIIKHGSVWKGFNTDIPGFQRDLKEKIDPANKKAAVLGAGGAARAVVFVLANSGAKEIVIYDIDKAKAQNVVGMVKNLFPDFNIRLADRIEELDIRNKQLLINTTPVGMKHTDSSLITEGMLHKSLFVYDLIYNPPETKLLKLAKDAGARTSNGLRMLLYQAALSFGHFTGKEPPIKIMEKALTEGVKKI